MHVNVACAAKVRSLTATEVLAPFSRWGAQQRSRIVLYKVYIARS